MARHSYRELSSRASAVCSASGFSSSNARLACDYVTISEAATDGAPDVADAEAAAYYALLRSASASALGAARVLRKVVFAGRPGVRRIDDVRLLRLSVCPMSLTIGRGFYEDGIWADTAFIPYA